MSVLFAPSYFSAFAQGILGASSLVLGALLGTHWQPSRKFSAAILAFGSGTLLSAIAFEITAKAYRGSGFWPLLVGFVLGGGLFTVATGYVDQQGGFLRKPASRRRYLFEQRQEETSEVLDRIAQVEVIRHLPPAELQAIVPLLRPLQAQPKEVLCREGTSGDAFYMIVSGEAEVLKGRKVIAVLGPGQVFGEMALLTGEPRSATVVARTPMELYQLRQEHFDQLLGCSPHLAGALSRALAQRLRSATASQAQAEHNLDRWRQQVLDSAELDFPPVEEQARLQELVKRSAPLAILIGTLIDSIPESTVIGMTAGGQHFNGSFLLAVFISNFPEALSSAVGMKQSGTRPRQILGLWLGVVVISGLCAVLGKLLENSASGLVVALAQSISGGAILAMLASTMMPEAYELGGGSVAFSTILGFLTGFLVSSPQL